MRNKKARFSIILFSMIWGIMNSLLKAFMLLKFFKWFITSSFKTDFELNFVQALGIVFITIIFANNFSDLIKRTDPTDDVSEYQPLFMQGVITLSLIFILLLGFVFHIIIYKP